MCGKCVALCPVGVDSCGIKRAQRATVNNNLKYDYSYLNSASHNPPTNTNEEKESIYSLFCRLYDTSDSFHYKIYGKNI